ncbi:flagellar motor protein MotA [Roseospirillum parvum]|uniref:MotA/TolQ/ExbB proton channel family protein n=1 Tax=Roseospirillum parvum TaxID=83401 RepID=A0A1G8D0B1_9PROT|nr:flagellar motor protein MotA [Roseospirillum parvum]SDH51151.1 hypothetical protein SAMN05421742_107146 [Roseospirillum parvum]
MSRPTRFLLRMSIFLAAVVVVAALLFPPLWQAFAANPALNGLILTVFLIGVGLNIRQVMMLGPEVRWIESFRDGQSVSVERAPRLIAPMARMLESHQDRARFTLAASATRALLDGIAARLDELRDISRYFIGLLVFLGLLGTFWGLLSTVDSIAGVIRDLSIGGADITVVFDDLKKGLEAPLSGMGTAFSSSLFGLAGSLALGFLDLQAGQAQNRFYNDLEEWLSGMTRLSSGGGFHGGEEGGSVPAYIHALLEQTAESVAELQETIARSEDSRRDTSQHLSALTQSLSSLSDHMRAQQEVLLKVAEGQVELKPLLARLGQAEGGGGLDPTTRGHIRNIDAALSGLAKELAQGREQSTKEIRGEIKLLTRTIAAMAEEG